MTIVALGNGQFILIAVVVMLTCVITAGLVFRRGKLREHKDKKD